MNPPRGRRRQLGPLQKALATAGFAALVIATLLAGQALIDMRPTDDEAHGPIIVTGRQGQDIDVRTFTVRLISARYVSVIKAGGLNRDTTGIWAVLKVRLIIEKEAGSITYAAIVTRDGRTYRATDRFPQSLIDGSRLLQPGIGVEAEFAFELPRNALAGATARFAANRYEQRMDSMAEIELPGTTNAQPDSTPATLAPTAVVMTS